MPKEAQHQEESVLKHAREMLRNGSEILSELASSLDNSFFQAVHLIAGCNGCVITTGAGTSAAVAQRLSHLLATCSVRAFFVHPSDALHGASGRINGDDVIVVFSKAGRSQDINGFVEIAKERHARIIAVTWESSSALAALSDVVCITKTSKNTESENVLPFGSTIAASAYADAVCSAVRNQLEFDLKQLKRTHPWGGTPELLQ